MRQSERPVVHFTPRRGWINDPNGLIYVDGVYHLYAQHNPDDVVWGPMHWLHATSSDLLHWQEDGIALYPDALGTMYSGSAAADEQGNITLMYTAHGECEQQCIAFTKDGLHCEKYAGNPVIKNPGLKDFRDPKLFWNDKYGCWSVVVAASDRLRFYRTDDFKTWMETGSFNPQENRFGDLFECPDCFKMTAPDGCEIWVVIANMIFLDGREKGCRMQYFLGTFDGDTFVETQPHQEALRMDVGYDNYAGVTYGGLSQPHFMAWMTSVSNPLPTPGYCGAMTLARRLALVETGEGLRLSQEPVLPETQLQPIQNGETLPEGAFVVEAQASGAFEMVLQGGAGEQLHFGLDADGWIYTEREKSALFDADRQYNADARRITRVHRVGNGKMKIRVVSDGWIVEIFADDGLYAHGLLFFAQKGRSLRWQGDVQAKVGMIV